MTNLHVLYDFATVVAALFVVLDPIFLVPVIAGLSNQLEPKELHRIIYRIVGGATILLLFFTITGTWLLKFLGVTINDLRIGGGLLLLIIALRLVIEGRLTPDGEGVYRTAIVPLISPLLIGPGAITASVVLAAINGIWITALAGVVAMLLTLLLLLGTRFIYRLIGDSGGDLISRIMGILIATIAISYIRRGILALFEK